MTERLKIRAETVEDLSVLSALCQDAAVRVGDMTYDRTARRFVLILNRFRWEGARRGLLRRRPKTRVRTALRFDFIDKTQFTHLDRNRVDDVLELLAITAGPEWQGEGAHLLLTFSGRPVIRLEAEVIDATLDDLSAPWPAKSLPVHPDV